MNNLSKQLKEISTTKLPKTINDFIMREKKIISAKEKKNCFAIFFVSFFAFLFFFLIQKFLMQNLKKEKNKNLDQY